MKSLLPFVTALGLATTLTAQTTTFLDADRHELTAGESLDLRFHLQDAETFAPAPWPSRFDWFLIRAAGKQQNVQDTIRPADPTQPLVRQTLLDPGITLLAADTAPRIERVDRSELATFLSTKIGARTLPPKWRRSLPDTTIRVRRIESTKLLVRVVDDEGWLPSSATAQSKTGQKVEIRPLGDPTSTRIKSDLPLRIYVPNPEKAGTKVIARHLASGRAQSFLTDRAGTGFFTVSVPGVWLVEVHHATRLAEDPEADWEIHSATLSFEVPTFDPREGEKR